MANASDPLANSLSGSDPQNLLEYITRQKIYDSRYWKEECFGLTVADVLEKAAKQLPCIGGLPTKFLPLLLKLLQLQPETDLVVQSFIEQDEFKYVRALGCLYVRFTARPVDVYGALERVYNDFRRLRVWTTVTQEWSLVPMDEFVHDLLLTNTTTNSSRALGLALPRLPTRRALQSAGYLDGPRVTALTDVLRDHGNDAMTYFRYKVQVEQSPAAMAAWERRCARLGIIRQRNVEELEPKRGAGNDDDKRGCDDQEPRNKKKSKKYYGLFKEHGKKMNHSAAEVDERPEQDTNNKEYWDAERARLGLKPLRK
jgi:pre-mRNA-splicing factor 38A